VIILRDLTEKPLSSNTIYRGRILNLRVDTVELPDGRTGKREVVEHSGAVIIVPVNQDGQILLVRQYRYSVGRITLELPAGNIEPGESLESSARRELKEETGYEAKELTKLFSFFSTPGFSNEELHVFFASDLALSEQNLDDDEFVEVLAVPWEKAMQMVWTGEICDAASVAGIIGANHYMKKTGRKL
jgi:ADP-ribose pyrophosphatase